MKLILIGVAGLLLVGCGKPQKQLIARVPSPSENIYEGEPIDASNMTCEAVGSGIQCRTKKPPVLPEKECPLIKRMMICNDGFVVIKDTKGGAGIPQSECAKHSGTNDTFVVHTLRMGEHYRLVLAAQGEDISDVELKKELP